ncbi:MAG: NAD(P)-dependent glycerol-3-phosphate dehydrogenase [Myxococcales bacterium]|nr:NAD(P)-dependent glycerol-3-phosphate dehydrogenase [Myxococcales bacterium]
MEIAVVGAGSWGTALAKTLADKGHAVTLWARSAEHAAQIEAERDNARYLPGAGLPSNLRATADLEAAVRGRVMIVSVVPSHTVRDVIGRAAAAIDPGAIVVSASKGIENQSLATMDEVLTEVLPGARLTYLSGPSFAKEVGRRLPTAVVIASRDREAARVAQEAFAGDRFRVYTSDDVTGVELGGALKNVMAIGAGIADGLGFGHNARAALITRGLAEITRLAVRRGANPQTLAGLAGMGDLVLTCTGDLSRNRSVGVELGKGRALGEVLAGMSQVAEGVKTTQSARDLGARLGVELPITEMVWSILYREKPAMEGVVELLTRPMKHELA